MVERDDGWCDWVRPLMAGYRMACCDCGLVHDMQFQVIKRGRTFPDGSWEGTEVDGDKFRVAFRARRNKRATAQVRRHKST